MKVKLGFSWQEQQSPVGKDTLLPPKLLFRLLKEQGRRMSPAALTGQKHSQTVVADAL